MTFLFGGIFYFLIALRSYDMAAQRFESDQDMSASCGIVFMGDFDKNRKTLGNETFRRLSYIKTMYSAGRVRKIICTGGARPKTGYFASQSAKEWLESEGIEEDIVHAENESCDTISNIQHSFALVDRLQCKSVALISSPVHLTRIRMLMKEMGINYPGNILYSAYDPGSQLPQISKLEKFNSVHHEWISKFVYLVLSDDWFDRLKSILRECESVQAGSEKFNMRKI